MATLILKLCLKLNFLMLFEINGNSRILPGRISGTSPRTRLIGIVSNRLRFSSKSTRKGPFIFKKKSLLINIIKQRLRKELLLEKSFCKYCLLFIFSSHDLRNLKINFCFLSFICIQSFLQKVFPIKSPKQIHVIYTKVLQ